MNNLHLQHPALGLPQLFTELEASRLLKISQITLKRIRLRGEIKFSRIGGSRVIYTDQQLLDYINNRERIDIRNN